MVKLCKKCKDRCNSYILNPKYPVCYYGYTSFLKDELNKCPLKDCPNYSEKETYDLVDTQITDEDYKIIIGVSLDIKFIDAMIELKEKDPIEFQLKMSQFRNQVKQQEAVEKVVEQQNTPHCPMCNNTNIRKISGTAKVAGAAMFGLFSKTARSQFKCENCGYKW